MHKKHGIATLVLIAATLLTACGGAAPTATVLPTALPTAAPTASARPTTAPTAALTSTTAPTAATGTDLPQDLVPTPLATIPTDAAPSGNTVPATPTAAGPLTKVRLALDWTPNTNHTGFYVAQQKGWYAAQGIDLEILPYSDSISPDALVAAGQADFAISFVEQVVIDRAGGLPVQSVAAIVQHNTSELVTLKGSGIDRPAKLGGTRYAGFGSDYEEPVISRMITCDKGTNTAFQNITTDLAGLQALEGKQADFVWIYQGWEAIQARHDGFTLNEFPIRDFCVPDYPSPVIIAGEQFITQQAALGRRFLAATAQGYGYAIAHPDDAAALLIAATPADTFPDKTLVQESARFLAGQYQAEAPHWGVQTLAQWSGYPQFMVQTGKVEDANHQPVTTLDYAGMFTNDLLPAP